MEHVSTSKLDQAGLHRLARTPGAWRSAGSGTPYLEPKTEDSAAEPQAWHPRPVEINPQSITIMYIALVSWLLY